MDTVPSSDECQCAHHLHPELSFCEGQCCKECPQCKKRIVTAKYDTHVGGCVPDSSARYINPFDNVPASRIDSALERVVNGPEKSQKS